MARLRTREGKLSFLLLMLMLLSIAWSMEFAGWVEGLYVVEWTALGGLATGFLMTRLRWPRAGTHLLSAIIGASLIIVVVARYIDPALGLRDGVVTVAYHFDAWVRAALSAKNATDAVSFVLLVTLAGWWVGYISAWMVFGAHRVWQALAVTGSMMLLVSYGSPPEIAPFFVVFILCGLVLALRLNVYTQEQSWDRDHARYDRDIALNFLRDGGLLVLGVVAVVWIAPLLSSSSVLSEVWARWEGPWRTAGDEWNRIFSGVVGHNRGYENMPFGDRLALGGPVDLGEDIVMWVVTDGARYWRGAVYDRYDGRGWTNTDDLTAVVAAKRDFPSSGSFESRRVIEQTIMPSRSGLSQVFHLGEPFSLDIPVEIQYSSLNDGDGNDGNALESSASVSTAKTRIPVGVDNPYQVFSTSTVADAASLRGAGADYPEWISSRYLQLPSELPDRVEELALEIVAPHQSVYDQAVAIQDYLRSTIRYRQDIETPPEGRDAIDYLLFDSREGYCNYYASAMVVLARASGIPARLAVGYVGGELEPEAGRYVVRERNSHAWVEVFFPRFGWVEFEPTASEVPIRREEAGDDQGRVPAGGDTDAQLDRDLERLRGEEMVPGSMLVPSSTDQRRPSLVLAGSATAMFSALAATVVWYARRSRAETSRALDRLYGRMCGYARLLGVKAHASQTPYEYASLLCQRLPQSAELQVRRIVELFVRDRFEREGISRWEQQEAEEYWTALRPLMWQRVVRRIPGLMLSALSPRSARIDSEV
jgi:transglutaminase-like putative cysteine protease